MSDAVIANLQNPMPILQQDKSSIVTNPFIPNEQREKEIAALESEANTIIASEYNNNKTSSVKNQSLAELNSNVAKSLTGLFDDLFTKPNDIPWRHYLPTILQKDQRYAYLGILCLVIAFVYIISNQS